MKEKYQSAFISYTLDSSTKARQIEGYLKPLDVDCYLFEYDEKNKGIEGQEDIAQDPATNIRNMIEQKAALIFVLSAKSRESLWVSNELGIATGMGKKIFVYKITHNLLLPRYQDKSNVVILSKLDELDQYFGE